MTKIESDIASRLKCAASSDFEGWNNYTDVDGWEEWDHYEEEL